MGKMLFWLAIATCLVMAALLLVLTFFHFAVI